MWRRYDSRVQKRTPVLFFVCLFDRLIQKINGFRGLIVKHFFVKFSDPSSIVYEIAAEKPTDKQTDNSGKYSTSVTAVRVNKK